MGSKAAPDGKVICRAAKLFAELEDGSFGKEDGKSC
jgi:hypothetical protein